MRKWIILFAVVYCGACADDLNKDALEELPVYTTAVYALSYAIDPAVGTDATTMGLFLDRDFFLWQQCMQTHYPEVVIDMTLLQSFRHIIVPTAFACHFHDGVCTGEYSRPHQRIYLAYESLHGSPILTDWHEWRDLTDPPREDTDGACNRGI